LLDVEPRGLVVWRLRIRRRERSAKPWWNWWPCASLIWSW